MDQEDRNPNTKKRKKRGNDYRKEFGSKKKKGVSGNEKEINNVLKYREGDIIEADMVK